MGLILFGIIGRKVDGHVPANGEGVSKHLFPALTSSRKRAELIEGPGHSSQAVEPRRDGMLDVTEGIAVLMFTNHYILWKALKHYCLLG
jgi:hypothetical protein